MLLIFSVLHRFTVYFCDYLKSFFYLQLAAYTFSLVFVPSYIYCSKMSEKWEVVGKAKKSKPLPVSLKDNKLDKKPEGKKHNFEDFCK